MLGRCSLRFTRALYIYVYFPPSVAPRRENSSGLARETKENLDRRARSIPPSIQGEEKKKKSCLSNDVAIFQCTAVSSLLLFFFLLRRIVSSFFFFLTDFSYLFPFSQFSRFARDLLLTRFVETRLCYELYRMSFTNHVRTLQKVTHNTHARQSRMCIVIHTRNTRNYKHMCT